MNLLFHVMLALSLLTILLLDLGPNNRNNFVACIFCILQESYGKTHCTCRLLFKTVDIQSESAGFAFVKTEAMPSSIL